MRLLGWYVKVYMYAYFRCYYLGINSSANLPTLVLKPGSCTENISLEDIWPLALFQYLHQSHHLTNCLVSYVHLEVLVITS